MDKKEYVIENQGHTIACLLRERLFNEGATFAACIVKHPQDKNLNIVIEADDPKKCLLSAISSAELVLDNMIKAVTSYQIHNEIIDESMKIHNEIIDESMDCL
tara:strand:- start:610 stop:918 length:309 start_codon:yes stop_codon:yes gene_type:complete